jgi:hypothetical protein
MDKGDEKTFTKIYTGNVSEEWIVLQANNGYSGVIEQNINRIDKIAPEATSLSYAPTAKTNGAVLVTLTTSEQI